MKKISIEIEIEGHKTEKKNILIELFIKFFFLSLM